MECSMPDQLARVDQVEQLPRLGVREHRRLSARYEVLRAAPGRDRIAWYDVPEHQRARSSADSMAGSTTPAARRHEFRHQC
jgi:hypothetical protein